MRGFRCLMFVPLLLIFSCRREEPWSEEARIRDEVDRRVDAVRTELNVTENRWRSMRVVAFCLLAGGSLIWLFNGGGSSVTRNGQPVLPEDRGHDPNLRRRVIDRHYPDYDDTDDPPYRR